MTAALASPRTTTPTRTGTGPAAGGTGRRGPGLAPPQRPRLLLPPVADPSPGRPAEALGPTVAIRSVLSPVTSAGWPVAAAAEPEPAPRPVDPAPLCGAVVLAAIEALSCVRPLAQLARWVTPEVYEALARAVGPAPAATRRRAVVRRVLVCPVGTVVVHDGTRVRAAAVRVEERRGSWRATVLQIG